MRRIAPLLITSAMFVSQLLFPLRPHASPQSISPRAFSPGAPASLRVTVTKNGLPLPGWPVHLRQTVPSQSPSQPPPPDLATTVTGADGAVLLRNVPGGALTVIVDAPWSGTSSSLSQPVRTVPGEVTSTALDIATGRIAGAASVLSLPLPGAQFSLFRAVPKPVLPGAFPPTPDFFRFADTAGRFQLDVPPGDYHAQLSYQDGATLLWSGPVTVRSGETQTIVPPGAFPRAAILFGRVRKGGTPMPELFLTVYSPVGAVLARALTDSQGQFVLPVPPGILTVAISDLPITDYPQGSSAGTLFVVETVAVGNASRKLLDLDLSDRVVGGRVTRNGQPLPGAAVSAVDYGLSSVWNQAGIVALARTDAAGRFRIRVPAGRNLSLEFVAPGGQYISAATPPFAAQINATWPTHSLTGSVRTADGRPVPNYPIGFQPGDVAGRTGPDGTFTVDDDGSGSAGQMTLYGGGLYTPFQVARHLLSGRLSVSTITLPSMPGRIEGRIDLAAGGGVAAGPLAGAAVRVGGATVPVTTDVEGRFAVDGVPPGPARVDVLPYRPYFLDARSPVPSVASASIEVREGKTAFVSVDVVAGRLDARVRLDERDVVPAFLWVAQTGGRFQFELPPDAAGEFHALVPPGPYAVEYAPGRELTVPGIAPQLASRLVAQVDVPAGGAASVALRVRRLVPNWVADLGPGVDVHSGLLLAGDSAYFGADDGTLSAVAARGPDAGRLLWRHALNAPVRAAPLSAGGRLFVATVDGTLHAFDLRGGPPIGEAPGFPVTLPGFELLRSPVWAPRDAAGPLDGDVVLVGSGISPSLIRVDGETGVVRGEVALPSPAVAAPLPLRDRLIVSLEDGRTVALDPAGGMSWQRSFDDAGPGVYGPPSAGPGGRLFQGSDAGSLEAMLTTTGRAPARWPAAPLLQPSAADTFNGIRDVAVATADGRMLVAPAGDLGLLSLIAYNGQICPTWPWTTRDPFGHPNLTPYRYLGAPADVSLADGSERLFASALLEPGPPVTNPCGVADAPAGSASALCGFAYVGPQDRSETGVFLSVPMDHPGNDYRVFYGDAEDRFVGRPVATGNGPGDVVLGLTESGRLYAFPAVDR